MRKQMLAAIICCAATITLTGCAGSSNYYYQEEESEVKISSNGFCYVYTGENEVAIVKDSRHQELSGGILIPSEINGAEVTAIQESAFEECNHIESVTIPDNIETIGYRAFYSCDRLGLVNIMDGVEEIRSSAFADCALNSIVIPNSVDKIGYGAFADCTDLSYVENYNICNVGTIFSGTPWLAYYEEMYQNDDFFIVKDTLIRYNGNAAYVEVPYGVRAIGSRAFSRGYDEEDACKVQQIVLPDTITDIYSSAFENCCYLTDINIPDGVTEINDSVFNGCKSLGAINIPDRVTSIGQGAFSWCAFQQIDLPDSITKIEEGAFGGCELLTEIEIPEGIEVIEERTFWHCTSLESVTLPDSVTKINGSAFENCETLRTISIPEKVDYIGDSAFKYCTSLNDINLPDELKHLGIDVFDNTPIIDKCRVGGFLILDGVCFGYDGMEEVVSVPDGVRVLTGEFSPVVSYLTDNGYEFHYATSCIIPESVEWISGYTDFLHLKELCIKGSPETFSLPTQDYTLSVYYNMNDIYINAPIALNECFEGTIHFNGKMYSGEEYAAAYAQGIL